MPNRLRWLAATAAAGITLTLATGARADEIPLVTGKQWTESSEPMKKAYIVGIANVVQIDRAYHDKNPPADGQSIMPRLARGLDGQTIDSVRQGVDRWYATHPNDLARPVLETIWFEVVHPKVQPTK